MLEIEQKYARMYSTFNQKVKYVLAKWDVRLLFVFSVSDNSKKRTLVGAWYMYPGTVVSLVL